MGPAVQEELAVNVEHAIHPRRVFVESNENKRTALRPGRRRRTLDAAACLAYMAAALTIFMVCKRLSSSKQRRESDGLVMEPPLESSGENAADDSTEQQESTPIYDFPNVDDPQAREDLDAFLHFLKTPFVSPDGETSTQLELQTTVGDVNVEIVVSKIGPVPPPEVSHPTVSVLEAAEALESLVTSTTRFVLDGQCTPSGVAIEVVNFLADSVTQKAATATKNFEASSFHAGGAGA
ncbi:hypothetical protein Emed_003826 [Eimeria media]